MRAVRAICLLPADRSFLWIEIMMTNGATSYFAAVLPFKNTAAGWADDFVIVFFHLVQEVFEGLTAVVAKRLVDIVGHNGRIVE